jgi:DNA invertase Pin-like site-specific DNA recombinase
MVKPTRPVDIYVRVSRVGGREHRITEGEQERRARELASQRGLTIGKVLVDLDESGGKLDRPGLQEAVRRVEAGQSSGLIVAWLDRLSRDSEHAHGLIRRINEAGGALYAPDAPADATTPEGELQVGIIFAFAQYVRMRARAGFERAKENAIANGVPVHTRPAVGYRTREDRRLEPDPAVAPIVREMFERRAQGDGPAVLGRFLEARGVRTSQGSATWSKPAVYGLLKNRVYLGELRYGRDSRFVNSASHEPIVDVALWHAAQHPNGRQLSAARSEDTGYLLSGLLRCGGCRYCLQGTMTSRRKRIYRCTRTHAAGVCTAPARVDADRVEEAAIGAFWTLTADLEARGEKDIQGELLKLERALGRAERTLVQWTSADVQEAIGDLAEYAAGLRERRDARDQAAEALGSARAKSGVADFPKAETLRGAWERMGVQERRQLLGLRLDCLALGRDRRLVVYPAGLGPTDLPRRGFRQAPTLAGFPDAPRGARALVL